jgi:hypothetical protein
VTLHHGDKYAARFCFVAGAAASSAAAVTTTTTSTSTTTTAAAAMETTTYSTSSLDPNNAQALGHVSLFWSRACDDDYVTDNGDKGNEGSSSSSPPTQAPTVFTWTPPVLAVRATSKALQKQQQQQALSDCGGGVGGGGSGAGGEGSAGNESGSSLLSERRLECPSVVPLNPPFDVSTQRPVRFFTSKSVRFYHGIFFCLL